MCALDRNEKTGCGWMMYRSAERGNASAEIKLGNNGMVNSAVAEDSDSVWGKRVREESNELSWE